MKKLAVIGPGLLGGSIALAARRLPGWSVSAWARRPAAVDELLQRGLVDAASIQLAPIAEDADLVVLCVPIGAMPALAAELAEIVPGHAIITDVGSVKTPVVSALTPLFQERGHFIGSHPMAGSEQTGLDAARADLFDGAVCILTPQVDVSRMSAVEALMMFWGALGCRTTVLSPEKHDEVVALVSHLPHLFAAALVNSIARQNRDAFQFAGPGFRDTTRVASGPPRMWAEILTSNRAALRKSAEAMIEMLRESLTLLDSPPGDDTLMNQFLETAKSERDRLRLPR